MIVCQRKHQHHMENVMNIALIERFVKMCNAQMHPRNKWKILTAIAHEMTQEERGETLVTMRFTSVERLDRLRSLNAPKCILNHQESYVDSWNNGTNQVSKLFDRIDKM